MTEQLSSETNKYKDFFDKSLLEEATLKWSDALKEFNFNMNLSRNHLLCEYQIYWYQNMQLS